MIEKGRYEGTERERRFCHFFKYVVEDEFHFVLVWPLYSDYRSKYIPDKYHYVPKCNKFNIFIASKHEATTTKSLAAFLYHSFHLRKNIYLLIRKR